jgi:hypothetical protein
VTDKTTVMTFIKANLISLLSLTLYFLWLLFIVFDFNKKVYDNDYAGAVSVEFIAFVTAALIVVYSILFLVTAIITRK